MRKFFKVIGTSLLILLLIGGSISVGMGLFNRNYEENYNHDCYTCEYYQNEAQDLLVLLSERQAQLVKTQEQLAQVNSLLELLGADNSELVAQATELHEAIQNLTAQIAYLQAQLENGGGPTLEVEHWRISETMVETGLTQTIEFRIFGAHVIYASILDVWDDGWHIYQVMAGGFVTSERIIVYVSGGDLSVFGFSATKVDGVWKFTSVIELEISFTEPDIIVGFVGFYIIDEISLPDGGGMPFERVS